MAGNRPAGAERDLERLFKVGMHVGLIDDLLLARFVAHCDDAVFETLVKPHGLIAVSVCRGVLRDPHDLQDAFHTTFFVLARKAQSIRDTASLGSWLCRVAYNLAIQINYRAACRRRREGGG